MDCQIYSKILFRLADDQFSTQKALQTVVAGRQAENLLQVFSFYLKTLMTSFFLTLQRFRRQHHDGRATVRSRRYPSIDADTCCSQSSCWYIEQSTGRSCIDIRRKWRRGAYVSHIQSWVQCFWRGRGGDGIWWDALVAYASSDTEPSSATKAEFTTTSISTSAGRFAGVVLDVSVFLADYLLYFVSGLSFVILFFFLAFSVRFIEHCRYGLRVMSSWSIQALHNCNMASANIIYCP